MGRLDENAQARPSGPRAVWDAPSGVSRLGSRLVPGAACGRQCAGLGVDEPEGRRAPVLTNKEEQAPQLRVE